jgi:hypothetical protein
MAAWIGAGSPLGGLERGKATPFGTARRPASAQTAPTIHVIVESTI